MDALMSNKLGLILRAFRERFGQKLAEQFRVEIEERIAEIVTAAPVDNSDFQRMLNASMYPFIGAYEVLARAGVSQEGIKAVLLGDVLKRCYGNMYDFERKKALKI